MKLKKTHKSKGYQLTPRQLAKQLNSLLWQNARKAPAVIILGSLAMIPTGVSNLAQASELDVYQPGGASLADKPEDPPEKTGPKLMIMLSNNSTMGHTSIAFDYPELDGLTTFKAPASAGGGTQIVSKLPEQERTKTIQIGNKTYQYTEYYYQKDGKEYLSRKDRALQGLLELLDHPERLPKNTSLGLSFYGFDAGQKQYYFNFDNQANPYPTFNNKNGRYAKALEGKFYTEGTVTSANTAGIIVVPILPLQKPDGSFDQAVINRLKREAIKMTPSSNFSPVGDGYAEGTAYMLGSSTIDKNINPLTQGGTKVMYPIRYSKFTNQYSLCVQFQRNLSNTGGCKDNARSWVPLVSPYKEEFMKLLDKDSNGNYINDYQSGSYTWYRATGIQNSFGEQTGVNASAGITYSADDTKNKSKDPKTLHYISPLDFSKLGTTNKTTNQCSSDEEGTGGAYGFYFLTDGKPNHGDVQDYQGGVSSIVDKVHPRTEIITVKMDSLFKRVGSGLSFSCLPNTEEFRGYADSDGTNNQGRSGWNCILAAAKKLQEKNDKYPTVRTAVAGYGNVYTSKAGVIPEDKGFTQFNSCNQFRTNDHKERDPYLACQWGQKEYGNGGFYVVNNGKGLANSIVAFAESLQGTSATKHEDYTAQSGDGMTIAADVTDNTKTSSFAYLPMMLPRPSSNKLIWDGNVKKYNIKQGSVFDKNDKHLYDSISGAIKSDAEGVWNTDSTPDGADIRKGGMYAQLTAPTSSQSSSTRTVFVEKSGGGIQKISVQGGQPQGFDALGYTRQQKQYLLNFLGYNVPVFNDAGQPVSDADYAAGADPLNNVSSFAPTTAIKVLGGVNNSKPEEIMYGYKGGTSTPTTTTTSTTENAILFGSLDGALHLVDAKDGKELFAFIPKAVINSNTNIAALKEGSTKLADGTENPVGNLAFGVDAPWYVRSEYTRDIPAKTITANKVIAYGGLGRGGEGFYALNIKNKENPSLEFKIDKNSSGFSRLGQVWSQPVPAKVRMKQKDADGKSETESVKNVLFISGGYDLCYDNPSFVLNDTNLANGNACKKSQAQGNAVYMIDADNGKLLWSATKDTNSIGKNSTNANLTNSIAGQVAAIDSNLDGLVDTLYFADLGGQLFRADFDDKKLVTEDGWAKRVVRLLDTKQDNYKVPLRFFFQPVVSVYKLSGTTVSDHGKPHVLISIASGDRNSPIGAKTDSGYQDLDERKADKNPNKLITFWDADAVNNDILKIEDEKLVKDKKLTDLIQLGTASTPSEYKNQLVNGPKRGWYYDLTYFSGESSAPAGKGVTAINASGDAVTGNTVNYLKAIGQPNIRAGRLYASIFNRLAYIPAGQCAAAPTGVSEAQEYCLPFGVCPANGAGSDSHGRGHTYVSGAGISSVVFGAKEPGSNVVNIITPEQNSGKNNGAGGTTGGATGSTLTREKQDFASKYKLLPNEWFERNESGAPAAATPPSSNAGTQ